METLYKTHRWQAMLEHLDLIECAHEQKSFFFKRSLNENILVLLLQFIGLMFSTLTVSPSPIWYASGSACALVFLRGYAVLPGIGLGSLFAYLAAHCSLTEAFFNSIVYVIQAALLLTLSHRYVTPTLIFYQPLKFLKFIVLSCIVTSLSCVCLLEILSHAHHVINPTSLWLEWWLANLNGLFIFAFALVTWDAYFPEISKLRELPRFTIIIYTMLIMLNMIIVSCHTPSIIVFSSLLIWALIITISFYYGWCGTISSALIAGFIQSVAASIEAPVFMLSNISVIYLQVILLSSAITGLMVSVFLFYRRMR